MDYPDQWRKHKPFDWHDQIEEKRPWCWVQKNSQSLHQFAQVVRYDPNDSISTYLTLQEGWVRYATPITREEILEMLEHIPEEK